MRRFFFRSLFLLLVCAVAFRTLVPAEAFAQQPAPGLPAAPNVLILHSYHKGLMWTDRVQQGMMEAMENGKDVNYFVEYMDSKRFFGKAYFEDLRRHYAEKYRNVPIRLILVSDDDAFNFALEHRALFSNAPLVFCGVNDFSPEQIAGQKDVSGVAEEDDIEGTIAIALKLHPGTQRIFVVADQTTTGKEHLNRVRRIEKNYPVSFEYLPAVSFAEMETALAGLPDRTIVLLTSYTRDKTGKTISHEKVAELVSSAAKVPVYARLDTAVEHGALGGKVVSGLTQGRAAGAIGRRILAGEDPAGIPVTRESPNSFVFNWLQMRRFGVPPTALPSNAEVVKKPVSLYAHYWLTIWMLASAFLITACFATYLVINTLRLKRAEKNLRRLAAAMSHSSEAIIFYDLSLTIEYVNPAFEKLAGESSAGLEGTSYADFLGRGWREGEWNPGAFFRDAHESVRQKGIWNGRYSLRRRDGSVVNIESSIARIASPSGEVTGYVSVQRDITDRLRLEDELFQGRKMQSLGLLAEGVAHDFNNILQTILGNVSLFLEDLPPQSPAFTGLEEIQKAAEKGAMIVRQLRVFGSPAPAEKTLLNLNACVADLARMLKRLIGETIEFDFLPGTDLHLIHWDRSHIEQILVNLCVNSRNTMPGGGAIRIETANVTVGRDYLEKNPLATEGRYVHLSFSDTGQGIPEDIGTRIFEPFFTTKRNGHSNGLGLAIVYGIMKQMGGFVDIESQMGKGTTFRLYFPAAPTQSQPGTREESPENTPGRKSGTILVAEDEESVRTLMERVLRSAGFKVLSAKDGEEAVGIFQEHKESIELILMDVVMPRMNGLRAAEHIRSVKPHVRILFLSGYSAGLIAAETGGEAPMEIINKPFKPIDLLIRIQDVLKTGD